MSGHAHAADVDPGADEAPVEDTIDPTPGESRWIPVAVVVVFMAINLALRVGLPRDGVIRVPWLLPVVEIALLLVLLTSDPSGPEERRRVRQLALTIVGLLVVAALWATALLVDDLIRGTGPSNSPSELLAEGCVVWLGNNLAFSLLYWLMDGGGPIARSRRIVPVDFAFTQQLNPELGQPGWRPVFLDYLHLGFTNSTAFSPTDVMPLSHRAKYAMLVQATVALLLFGLVVARAVNAFT